MTQQNRSAKLSAAKAGADRLHADLARTDAADPARVPCAAHAASEGGTRPQYQTWCPSCRSATAKAAALRTAYEEGEHERRFGHAPRIDCPACAEDAAELAADPPVNDPNWTAAGAMAAATSIAVEFADRGPDPDAGLVPVEITDGSSRETRMVPDAIANGPVLDLIDYLAGERTVCPPVPAESRPALVRTPGAAAV